MIANAELMGIWQIPQDERALLQDGVLLLCGTPVFVLDEGYVTLFLLQTKGWGERSPDDFYKLKSKWQDQTLYYLPPSGDWAYLADLDQQQFVARDQQQVWTYKRVSASDLDPADRAIVDHTRAPYAYGANAAGARQE